MSESWVDAQSKALCGCALCVRGKYWTGDVCRREFVLRGIRGALDEAERVVDALPLPAYGFEAIAAIRALKGDDHG